MDRKKKGLKELKRDKAFSNRDIAYPGEGFLGPFPLLTNVYTYYFLR